MDRRFSRPGRFGERRDFGEKREFEKPVKVGETHDVEISEVGSRGDGITRIKNFVIFVPDTQKDEKCKIKITEVRNKYAIAKKVEEGSEEETETVEEEAVGEELPEEESGDIVEKVKEELNIEDKSEEVAEKAETVEEAEETKEPEAAEEVVEEAEKPEEKEEKPKKEAKKKKAKKGEKK